MLNPSGKDKPLKDAVIETIETVSRTSIPKFIDRGLRQLKEDAENIRKERAEKKLKINSC